MIKMRIFIKIGNNHIIYLKDDDKEAIEKYTNNEDYVEQYEL
jgi:polynucleotide 5'-kinase involved in rRNA processing